MSDQINTGITITVDAQSGITAIQSARNEIDQLHQSVQSGQQILNTNITTLDTLTKSHFDMANALQNLTVSQNTQNQSLQDSITSFGNFKNIVQATMGAVAADTIKSTMAINEMHMVAQSLGMSTQVFSELQFAAASVNIPADQFGQQLKRMTANIARFAESADGQLGATFQKVNLDFQALNELSPDQQLLEIGKALDNLDSTSKKVFVTEVLAGDLSRMIPLFEKNAKGIKETSERARELGVSVSDIDAKKVAAAATAIAELEAAFVGIGNSLAVSFSPVITNVATFLANNLSTAALGAAVVISGKLTSSIVSNITAMRLKAKSAFELAQQNHHLALSEQAGAKRALENAWVMKNATQAAHARTTALANLAIANGRVAATEKALASATDNFRTKAILASRATRILKSSLAFFGGPLGIAITAGLAAITWAMSDQKSESKELKSNIDLLTGSVDKLTVAQARQALQATSDGMTEAKTEVAEYQKEIDALEQKMAGFTNDPDKLYGMSKKAYQEWNRQLIDAQGNLDTAKQKVDGFAEQQRSLEDHIKRTTDALNDNTGTGKKNNIQTDEQAKTISNLVKSLKEKEQALGKTKRQQLEATLIANQASDPDKKAALAAFDAAEPFRQARAASEAYAAALSSTSKELITFAQQSESGGLSVEKHERILKNLEVHLDGTSAGWKRYEAAVSEANKAFDNSQQKDLEKWFESFQNRVEPAKQAQESFNTTIERLQKLFPEGSEELQKYTALAQKELDETLGKSEEQLSVYQESFERAAERIDKVFADAWMNLDEGFDGVVDGITSSFKQMLAEMAHEAITRPIVLGIQQAVLGDNGNSANTSASDSGTGGLNPTSLLSSDIGGSGWFSSTSISQGIAKFTGVSPGLSGSAAIGPTADIGSAFTGNTAVAGPSNLAMGVAGIAGGIGANLLYGGKGQSGIGGSLGSMAGMYLASGPFAPLVAVAGMILGGGLGSLFGGEREPEFDFRTRDESGGRKFEDEESGVIAQSAFGDLGFDANNTHKLKSSFGGFENAQKFLNTLALMDNAIAGLAQSDDELQGMVESVRKMDVEAGSPAGIMDQMSDRYLAALSHTTSRITDGITLGTETLTRHEFSRDDFKMVEFEQMVVSVENSLLEAFLKLDTGKAIPAITSIIQMERIGDAIGGAVTDDLYRALNEGGAEGADLSALTVDLNAAMSVLPALDKLNAGFDMTAVGALNTASEMVKLAGGVENLSTLQNQYYDLFYTEEEKKAEQQLALQGQVNAVFAELNTDVPESMEAFRQLKGSLDLASEEGQRTNLALLRIAPSFAHLFDIVNGGKDSIDAFANIASAVDESVRPVDKVGQALDKLGLSGVSVADAVARIDEQSADELAIAAEGLGISAEEGAQYVAVLTDANEKQVQANKDLANSYKSLQQRIHDVLNPQTDDEKIQSALAGLGLSGLSVAEALDRIDNMDPEKFKELADAVDLAGGNAYEYGETLLNAYKAENQAKESNVDVTDKVTAAVDKSNDAQEERNRLLEEEHQRLLDIQDGYKLFGMDFDSVVEKSISGLVDGYKTNLSDVSGVEGLLESGVGDQLADLKSIKKYISDAEYHSTKIDQITSGALAQTQMNYIQQLNDEKAAEYKWYQRAIDNLNAHGNDLNIDRLVIPEGREDDIATLKGYILDVQSMLSSGEYDDLPSASEIVNKMFGSKIQNAEDYLTSITDGSLLSSHQTDLGQVYQDSGAGSLGELYQQEADLIDTIQSVEDSYGGLVDLIDENGNIVDKIAAVIDFTDDQINQLGVDFKAEFQQSFADAMDIDLEDVGTTFNSVASKYAQAAYSQEELLEIQKQGIIDQLAAFSDLGITEDMPISEFRDAFESVQGTVDAKTLARWAAASGVMADLHNTTSELASLNPDSAFDPLIKAFTAFKEIDTEDAANKISELKDRYDELSSSPSEKLFNQRNDAADTLNSLSTLPAFRGFDLSTNTSLDEFFTVFDQVKESADTDTVAKWWDAFDALSTFHSTADDIANLNIDDLAEQYPQLKELNQYVGDVFDHFNQKMKDVTKQRQAEIDLLKKQKDVSEGLVKYVEKLRFSEMNPAGPAEKRQEAEESYESLLKQVKAGNLDKVADLQAAADEYLKQEDSYFGRSDQYTDTFNKTVADLEALGVSLGAGSTEDDIKQLEEALVQEQQKLYEQAQAELEWAQRQSEQLTGIEGLLAEWPDKFAELLPKTEDEDVAGAAPVRPGGFFGEIEKVDRLGQFSHSPGLMSFSELIESLTKPSSDTENTIWEYDPQSREETEAFYQAAAQLEELKKMKDLMTLLKVDGQDDVVSLNNQQLFEQRGLMRAAQEELNWTIHQAGQLSGMKETLVNWPTEFGTLLDGLAAKIGSAVSSAIPAPAQTPAPTSASDLKPVKRPVHTRPYAPDLNSSYWDKVAQNKPVSATLTLDGSHAKGLGRVPFNGYRAELHKDEMVLPADVSEHIRQSMQPAVQNHSDPEMLRELQQLRAEVASLRAEQSQANQTAQRQRDDQHRVTESVARTNRKVVEVV